MKLIKSVALVPKETLSSDKTKMTRQRSLSGTIPPLNSIDDEAGLRAACQAAPAEITETNMEAASTGLDALFETGYSAFRERLRRRLGSADRADEALHDTWLRLANNTNIGEVRNLRAYAYRAALNVAATHRATESRHLNLCEVSASLHMMDCVINPEQIAEAQDEIGELETALAEIPPRRRSIIMLAHIEGVGREEIGRRFGISARMVGKELHSALDYCSERLDRKPAP